MVSGVEALIAKLQTLKKTQAKKAINKGARAGAKIVQAVAVRNAPYKSGNLQRNIKVRAMKRSRVWTGVTDTLSIFYGAFQELGTKHNKALHYLQRSAREAKESALSTAMNIIKDEIMKL